MLRAFLIAIALALISVGTASAQHCYSYPTYYPSYSYTPTYSYYAAGWWQGRWYPAGNYYRSGSTWYKQGGGIEYGLNYDPYAQAVAYYNPNVVAVPVAALGNDYTKLIAGLQVPQSTQPDTKLTIEDIAKLRLVLSQIPAQTQTPAPSPSPNLGLSADELTKLKALLAQVKLEK